LSVRDNGGEIIVNDDEWSLHSIWDPADRKTIGRTSNHMLVETASARTWESFPESGVSVSPDGNGDRLIIFDTSDQLYLWEHETGECVLVISDFH